MANIYAQSRARVLRTPQTAPIPGREAKMVPNNAGGYGFTLSDWDRLERFLILGSEGGTYYVSQKDLTSQNTDAVVRCIKEDGARVARRAIDINLTNRAPKTDQQLYVLALVLKHGDDAAKAAAREVWRLLRTGTHVLHFAAMMDSLGGWNRTKRRIVKDWFLRGRTPDELAFQVLKYRQRDGWSMRDLLRVAHPDPHDDAEAFNARSAAFSWISAREKVTEASLPSILVEYDRLMASEGVPADRALAMLEAGIPREALPTEAMNDPRVQDQLARDMPPHALLRNVGNLTAAGVLDNPEALEIVQAKLGNAELLRRARVHPFAILLAMLVYRQGHGVRGTKTWEPVKAVIEAMDDAYDAAFGNVEPTGRRILVGIDVSGSMNKPCIGTPIPASTAAAAMAITLARSEPLATVVTFDTEVVGRATITKRTAISALDSASGGGTNLAAPILWAGAGAPDTGMIFDAFVILTDHETWAGKSHPVQALDAYRRDVNPKAKLICVAMAANHANIVDDKDPLQRGCAGLDANLPTIVTDFIRA